MREREVSNLAGYAFLASTVLAIIHRLTYKDSHREAQVRPFSRDDRARLDQLRDLLDASWSGAHLYGAVPHRHLTATKHDTSVERRVESYDLVEQLVPDDVDFAVFVKRSNAVLAQLSEGSWSSVKKSNDDVAFVNDELTPFLRQLAHSTELIAPAARRQRVHSPGLV